MRRLNRHDSVILFFMITIWVTSSCADAAFGQEQSASIDAAPQASDAGKLDRKIVGRLTARTEPIRQQTTLQIQQMAKAKFRYLPELIAAAHQNCSQLENRPETKAAAAWPMPPISVISQLYLVGSTGLPTAQQCLIELLENQNSNVAIIAADVLGKNQFIEAIDALEDLKSKPDFQDSYGYRFNLVRALALMDDPSATEVLTKWRSDFDGQLRHEVDQLLQGIDESHFGDDLERFQRWQAAMQASENNNAVSLANETKDNVTATPKIVLVDSEASSESLDRLRLSKKRQYYGMDLHAKRLMFIIDHSSSMKEYSQGLTRLQRAKVELIRVISELDSDTKFAIVFYESVVRKWRDQLVEASDENKLEAIQFVKRLKYGDRTNTYTALRESIDFSPELEAVYLLTDGRPTEGPVIAPPAIVKDILHRNRFRHLNFNTIGVSVRGPTEEFLKALAAESGGEFRSLN